jgi:hypothetical protein
MDRVEWVTDQVRWSQGRGGDGGVVDVGEVVAYFEGGLMVIVVGGSMLGVFACLIGKC